MRKTLEEHPECLELRQRASCGYVVQTLPLHDAVRARHPECVRFLLESGANPDAYDTEVRYTPLGFAILLTHDSHEEIVSILLKHGASTSFDHGTYYGRTAYLEDSITKRWPKIMEMLLKYGSDLEDMVVNDKGEKQLRRSTDPPVIEAIWRQKSEILKLLLLRGASLHFSDNKGKKISIPHKILRFYKSSDRALEALKIYHEFGGDLSVKIPHNQSTEGGEEGEAGCSILDSLRTKPDKYGFKADTPRLEQEIGEMLGSPLRLQSQCRLAIKNIMGADYWQRAPLLPLPKGIINILLFMDLAATEIEEEEDYL